MGDVRLFDLMKVVILLLLLYNIQLNFITKFDCFVSIIVKPKHALPLCNYGRKIEIFLRKRILCIVNDLLIIN